MHSSSNSEDNCDFFILDFTSDKKAHEINKKKKTKKLEKSPKFSNN